MRALIVIGMALGVTSLACDRTAAAPTVAVERAWTRTADSGGLTAVYLVITNHESAPVTMSSVSSPLAESVSLHETMKMGDMVHMMPLEAPQVIAPGDSLVLHEGEKHLMVTRLTRRLAAGDTLSFTITLSDGRTLPAKAEVRAP